MAHRDRYSIICRGAGLCVLLPLFFVWAVGRHPTWHCFWRGRVRIDVVCVFAMGAQEISKSSPNTPEGSAQTAEKRASVDEGTSLVGVVELPPDIFSWRRPPLRTWSNLGPDVGLYPRYCYRRSGRYLAAFHAALDDQTRSHGVDLQQPRSRAGTTQGRSP